jgi:hypothetical protein
MIMPHGMIGVKYDGFEKKSAYRFDPIGRAYGIIR